MSRVLVTGGAGYVGSHVVRALVEAGREVVVLDDLSTGHRAAVGGASLIEGDLGDVALVERVLGGTIDGGPAVDAIVHLAARCLVGESMRDPAAYYDVNLTRAVELLRVATRCGIGRFVFSSSAAVYGEPLELPIAETHPTRPTNPYGETKLAFERALHWFAGVGGPAWCALRYFNAAGAHADGTLGEHHAHETHLVPLLIRSALGLNRAPVSIYGDDWPTADGSCVRDYVHVEDLAAAHLAALDRLRPGRPSLGAVNLGRGDGTSVRQMVEAVAERCGRAPQVEFVARRAGDPARLVASSERARRELGWSARRGLTEIVDSAVRWHRERPEGHESAGQVG